MSRTEPIRVVIDALKSHGVAVKKSKKGYSCCCPSHEDKNPSLSVNVGDDGRALIHCFAGCGALCRLAPFGSDTRRCAPRP